MNKSRFAYGVSRAQALRERYFSDARRTRCEDTCLNPITGESDLFLAANEKCEDGGLESVEVAGDLCQIGTVRSRCQCRQSQSCAQQAHVSFFGPLR